MAGIAYYVNGERSKIYLNIVAGYKCSNRCIFCDVNLLEKAVGNDLKLLKSPSAKGIIEALDIEFSDNTPDEVAFCGICEPTYNFDAMLQAVKHIKSRYEIKVRLNTNGHADLINPGRNSAKELADAGLDVVYVSLNAIDEDGYNKLHNPIFADAFPAVIKFIKDCRDNGIDTYVSFIELEDFDKGKAVEFVKDKLGLGKDRIKFRKLLA